MQKTNTLVQCPAKLDAFQTARRIWAPHLSSSERDFLFWLIDATVSYGRTWLDASLQQIATGGLWSVRDGQANMWQGPCHLSLATVKRVVTALRKKGIVGLAESPVRNMSRYTINLDWEAPMAPILPEPKRLNRGAKGGLKTGKNRCQIDTTESPDRCQNDTAHSSLLESSSLLEESSPSGDSRSGDNAEEVIRQIQSRPKKKHGKDERQKWLKAIWQQAWAEGQYDSLPPAFTPKLRGQLGQAVDRWPDKGEAIARWSIANWRTIMSNDFKWMKIRPDAPDPGFLLKHIMRFADAYAVDQRQANYDFSEDAEFKKLVASGMTTAEAWKEIGKREQRLNQTDKISEERARLAREFRAVEAERKQLQLERQKGGAAAKTPEEIIQELNDKDPPLFRQTRDFWSEESPPPIATNFGEWEDGDDT